MGKKIIVTFISTLLSVFFICPTYAEKIEIDREVLEKLLRRQEALEKRTEKLEKQLQQKSGGSGFSTKEGKYLTEDIKDLSERMDKVEKKSILDKITFSGDMRVRLDSIKYKDILINGIEDDADQDEIWTARLRLNLKSEITKDLIFHGRLNYFKLWGDSYDNSAAVDTSFSSVPDSEGDLHVERAYLDYFIPGTPLSLSVGRFATTEGPPNELRDNTTRKGTYPRLMVDGETDGILATLSLDNLVGLPNSFFRLGYGKMFQNYAEHQGIKLDDTRGLATAFETQVPGIKDSLFWLSYVRAWDMPSLGAFPDLIPSGITLQSYPEDAGAFDMYTLHLQFNNIMGSGLDWFGAMGMQNIKPGSEGTVFLGGYEVGLFCDNLHNNMGTRRRGVGLYTGLRYMLPIELLKNPKIGFEYNHGSKYWAGTFSAGGGDLVNKLAVNGDSFELYYIQPVIKKHLFLRLGGVYMDYDYYNQMGGYGTQLCSDMTITNYYLLMDARF